MDRITTGDKRMRHKREVQRGANGLRRAGQPTYPERLRDYLGGDHTAAVTDAFKAAVSAFGKERLDWETLSWDERRAFAERDPRWQHGPDGVLMWEPSSLTIRARENFLDCSWLSEAAVAVLQNQHGAIKGSPGRDRSERVKWLSDWSASWARWAYRYLSVVFDSAKQAAVGRGRTRAAMSASLAGTSSLASLRVFFLDYLPQSRLVDEQGRWPTPDVLLNAARHPTDSNELRDDFWATCCCSDPHRLVRGDGVTVDVFKAGSKRSADVQAFLDFVAQRIASAEDSESFSIDRDGGTSYKCPFLPRSGRGVPLLRGDDGQYFTPPARSNDRSCSWIGREYPHLSAWQGFAAEFVTAGKGVDTKLAVVSLFVGRYLGTAGQHGEPGEGLDRTVARHPLELLKRGNKGSVPDRLHLASESLETRRGMLEFIEHILQYHCTVMDDSGPVRLAEYGNPFSAPEGSGARGSMGLETLRQAMPYAWIRRLRGILVDGAHFKNWTWAQQAQQSERGNSADWFEVSRDLIDENDPDCVWRERSAPHARRRQAGAFVEMWSPVRWVALLIKLNTALRTVQVRVLDSGESDGLRFDLQTWAKSYAQHLREGSAVDPWVQNNLEVRNPSLAASVLPQKALRKRGGARDPHNWSNGVLRPVTSISENGRQTDSVIYVNTNKTADNKKEGAAKGFEVALPLMACPLQLDGFGQWMEPSHLSPLERQQWLEDLSANTHWWLAKLRDWQEKYNPIERRIEWAELSGTGLVTEKSEEQYAMYRPACFLFREPSMNKSKNHPGAAFPLPDSVVSSAWWCLNKELQERFAQAGKHNLDGSAIRLVDDDTGQRSKACAFDLHSIRVSLITALVVEGKVPIEIVQRLVGHSRVLMTLYYTKIKRGENAPGAAGGHEAPE